jgi:hypothetical protein
VIHPKNALESSGPLEIRAFNDTGEISLKKLWARDELCEEARASACHRIKELPVITFDDYFAQNWKKARGNPVLLQRSDHRCGMGLERPLKVITCVRPPFDIGDGLEGRARNCICYKIQKVA